MATRSAMAFLVCSALGCAGQSAPANVAPTSREPLGEPRASSSGPAQEPASDASPRALGEHATFGDLVRTARSLGLSEPEGPGECLLAREGSGYALTANLLPSLERMPDPPTDFGARFERGAEPFAVLTAWGIGGSPQASTVLAVFTATPATALSLAPTLLALDGDVGYVRGAADRSDSGAAALPIEHAVARAKQLAPAGSTLLVTANAGMPLDVFATALALLDAPPVHEGVALAVLLPEGTALPPAASLALSAEACPSGLPEVDGETPLGDLSREAVMPALDRLRERVAPCLSALRVPETRAMIALRVGEDGGIQRACFIDPGGLEARTASCVLLAAGALELPAPSPRGVVDLHLPLTLTAAQSLPAQRALCSAN